MTDFSEQQAQSVTFEANETFEQFADRIFKQQIPLRFKSGVPIKIERGFEYAGILAKLIRLLTKDEYEVVKHYFFQGLQQAEAAGQITPGLIVDLGTPFDIPTLPQIPDRFTDSLEEGTEIETHLTGRLGVLFSKKLPQVELEPEQEEEE